MPFVYRILFVDDEERLRVTTKAILESQGYDVQCAKDGLDGLAALKEWRPDLIISDLHMPNMNGFEFLSVIRQQFPDLPVIVISGEFSDADLPSSVLADAFFEKSEYTPDQLIARIADLARKAPVRSSVRKPNTRLLISRRASQGIA